MINLWSIILQKMIEDAGENESYESLADSIGIGANNIYINVILE